LCITQGGVPAGTCVRAFFENDLCRVADPETTAERDFSGYRQRYEDALFERVLPFWERHSLDDEHGGFFNCLGRDGRVYDRTKHAWMQGRQAWMFATLYRDVEERPAWLRMARSGLAFLQEHAVRPGGRVVYALTADGRPVEQTPPMLTECFYTMALAACARATGEAEQQREAEEMLERLWTWAFEEEPADGLDGQPRTQSFTTPMILLNVIEEVAGDDGSRYRREVEHCIARLEKHVHAETQTVRETVSPEGELLDSPAGRLLNPGHGIEAGWFLRHWAERLGRGDLTQTADDLVRWSFARGWDDAFGGLFTYLDADGLSPVELTWHMKLWWPCCEALYAHLLRYARTGEAEAWDAFVKTDAYVFDRFPDESPGKEYGEWFGYLDRRGAVTHRFKGGARKGCFHVPRALWQCRRLLLELEDRPREEA
jgi:N-acylglucosamine 2-epimerase